MQTWNGNGCWNSYNTSHFRCRMEGIGINSHMRKTIVKHVPFARPKIDTWNFIFVRLVPTFWLRLVDMLGFHNLFLFHNIFTNKLWAKYTGKHVKPYLEQQFWLNVQLKCGGQHFERLPRHRTHERDPTFEVAPPVFGSFGFGDVVPILGALANTFPINTVPKKKTKNVTWNKCMSAFFWFPSQTLANRCGSIFSAFPNTQKQVDFVYFLHVKGKCTNMLTDTSECRLSFSKKVWNDYVPGSVGAWQVGFKLWDFAPVLHLSPPQKFQPFLRKNPLLGLHLFVLKALHLEWIR